MYDFNSPKNTLAHKHFIERRSVLMAELQAWRELRVRHKQAIQKVGLANFVSWGSQKEAIRELGLKLTLLRVEMRNRQQKELDI